MKFLSKIWFLIGALTLVGAASVAALRGQSGAGGPSITFKGVEYFHRWSKDDQHEFTPAGQENLEQWSDMVTIHRYSKVTDGDSLADTANAVLQAYKANQAMVLRTDSVPRTTDKPAEYLIVVLFPKPEFIEAVFARFKIVDGIGTSTIYSRRVYGKKTGDEMSAWLKANGTATEKALMSLDGRLFPVSATK